MTKVTREQMMAAVRAHDNLSDIGTAVTDLMTKRGVNIDDAMYVAHQRALRIILIARGEKPDMTKMSAVAVGPAEMELMGKLASMWVDGLLAGLKVRE